MRLTGLSPADPDPSKPIGGFRIICNRHPGIAHPDRRIDCRSQGLVLPAAIKKRNLHFSHSPGETAGAIPRPNELYP
jgi:hypothetical protein